MRRMDGLSAFLLDQENTGAYQHTLKISILDTSDMPGGWSFDKFRESVAHRMHLMPMFRWKALHVPFGLHHPVWVDDPQFDLDYHLRRVACPAPGDRKAFCALVSQIYAWKMDLSRPMWVCWVVEGLENDEVALVTFVHHAYTDGSGAARLLNRFYSRSVEPREPVTQPWRPEPSPGRLALLGRAMIDLPVTLYRCLPKLGRAIVSVRKMNKKYRESGRELPPSIITDSRDSPLNVMVGYARTFVFETMDLEDIRQISKGFGVTINDLFVAVTAAAYRRLMISKGFDPDTGPLVTAIPVSKRPPAEEDDCIGNFSSADYLALPVHLNDPLERLKAAKHGGDVMKQHIVAAEGMDLSSLLEITPPALLRLLSWVVKRSEGRFSGIWGNAGISNVPGPREPLYLGTTPMTNWISMGQIFHGMALNTTVWSYAGRFNLCILADRHFLPDGWVLIDYFKEAFDEYRDLLQSQQAANA